MISAIEKKVLWFVAFVVALGVIADNALVAQTPPRVRKLQLQVLSDDTGNPVANATVESRVSSSSVVILTNHFVTDESGMCEVPLSFNFVVAKLELATRAEGFADAWLRWRPGHSELIPTNYTLRLVRPIPISGRVVDSRDDPIAGASVHFVCQQSSAKQKRQQSNEFDRLTVITAPDGRWQLNRIANDIWDRLHAYAEHPEYEPEYLAPPLSPEAKRQMRVGSHVFKLKNKGTLGSSTNIPGVTRSNDQRNGSDRTAPLKVSILLPDNTPAARAEVAFHSARMNYVPVSGAKLTGMAQGGRVVANTSGEFHLPNDNTVETLIVVHAGGYAEVPTIPLLDQPVIRLQPWGEIEGIFHLRGKPVGGAIIYPRLLSECVYFNVHPPTDQQGRFNVTQVPPGNYSLSFRIPATKAFDGPKQGFTKTVRVEPGEVAAVEIGRSGYLIKLRLRWPAGLVDGPNVMVRGAVNTPVTEAHRDIIAFAFDATPEASVYVGTGPSGSSNLGLPPEPMAELVAANHFSFHGEADGTYIAEGVNPGPALITFIAVDAAETDRQEKIVIVAAANAKVTVPADPPTGTIDLGEITLVRTTK